MVVIVWQVNKIPTYLNTKEIITRAGLLKAWLALTIG